MSAIPGEATGDGFIKQLVAAGVLPADQSHQVARVVIDARPGYYLTMHVQTVGDSRLLDVVPTLDGVEIRRGGEAVE